MDRSADDSSAIDRQQLKRRLVVNTVATVFGNMWSIVLGLVTLPILLVRLGSDAFGVWVLVQTFSAFTGWCSLVDFGIGVAGTRAIAESDSRREDTELERTVGTVLVTMAALGAAAAIVLSTIGRAVLPPLFNVPDDLVRVARTTIAIFALQTAIDVVTRSMHSCMEGFQRTDLARLADVVRRTAVAVAVCAAALAGGDLVDVAVASATASLVGVLVSWWILRATTTIRLGAFSMMELRRLMRYGIAVGALRPLGVIHRTIDRAVVGAVLGPAAVAAVEVATNLQSGADAVLGASSHAVTPGASWLNARDDRPALRELVARGTRLSLLACIPVTVFVALMSQPLVEVWLGDDAPAGAAGLASVAVVSTMLAAPLQVASNVLVGVGRAAIVLRAATISIVVNIAASIVLVETVGVVGAFQATIVASLVLFPLLALPALDHVGLGVREFLVRSVVRGIAPSAGLAAGFALLLVMDLSAPVTLISACVFSIVIGVPVTIGVALRKRI
jgi:O-antigen/teichoic acid export membrane protein